MSIVTRDDAALKSAWAEWQDSLRSTANLDAAKNVDKSELTNIPLTILCSRGTSGKTRFAVAMVGPFSGFQGYDFPTETDEKGRRFLSVVQDARPKEVKDADKDRNRTAADYPIQEAHDVQDIPDPKFRVGRVRARFVEGEIIEMIDKTGSKPIPDGTVAVAAVQTMIWHDKKSLNRVAVVSQLKRLVESVQMPVKDFVNWIVAEDLYTRHFSTEFPLYLAYVEQNPTAADKDKKNAAYRDNLVTIALGLPNDYRHPRLMKPNTSILLDKTDLKSDDTFIVKDFKTEQKKPVLSMQFQGMQWSGNRLSPAYDEDDTLFAIFPNLYTEHLAPLDISSPEHWKEIVPPVFDMLQGIYVGKENADKGARTQTNQDRISRAEGSWDKKLRTVNEPTGDKSLSFAIHLSTVAFIFDPVAFIESVCVRVSPAKIRERMGGSSPENIGVPTPKEFESSKIVTCISELDPSSNIDFLLNDDRYEFRALVPVVLIKKKNEKRDVFAKMASLDAVNGDLFVDFFFKCVVPGEDEFLETERVKAAPEDHPARTHLFQAHSETVYYFAINRSEWNRKREAALDKMAAVSTNLAIGNGGKRKRTNALLDAPESSDDDNERAKRAKKDDAEIDLNDDDEDDDDDDLMNDEDEDF